VPVETKEENGGPEPNRPDNGVPAEFRNHPGSGFDPEMLRDAAILEAYYLEGGARAFGDWSGHMLRDLGEAVRPHLEAFYNSARRTLLRAIDDKLLHAQLTAAQREQLFRTRAEIMAETKPFAETLWSPESGPEESDGRTPTNKRGGRPNAGLPAQESGRSGQAAEPNVRRDESRGTAGVRPAKPQHVVTGEELSDRQRVADPASPAPEWRGTGGIGNAEATSMSDAVGTPSDLAERMRWNLDRWKIADPAAQVARQDAEPEPAPTPPEPCDASGDIATPAVAVRFAPIVRAAVNALPIAIPIAGSASMLAIGALGRWPYGYFQLERLVVCASSAWLAIQAAQRLVPKGWLWASWAVAILFNPFAPVALNRTQWQGFDLAAAVVLAACALKLLLRVARISASAQRRLGRTLATFAILARFRPLCLQASTLERSRRWRCRTRPPTRTGSRHCYITRANSASLQPARGERGRLFLMEKPHPIGGTGYTKAEFALAARF